MKVTIKPTHVVEWCCEEHYNEHEATLTRDNAEIARLRAEMEQLTNYLEGVNSILGGCRIIDGGEIRNQEWRTAKLDRLKREHDEALAQLALFARKHPCCSHASSLQARALLDRLHTLEEFRTKVSTVLALSGPDDGQREIEQIQWLLDRLQQAEAIKLAAEPLWEIYQSLARDPDPRFACWRNLREALAAYRERA